MKKYFFIILVLVLYYLGIENIQAQTVSHYHIETSRPQQIMEHFGASDAWSMQYVGLWPEEKQKRMADWLFSTDNDLNGCPKGIGLSLWRFNLGAGSAEQGEASQINSPWTRTDCFLQADGTYDWNKQKGQRNFLQLAKERKVNHFLLFLNSPPIYYTQNGLAYNAGRGGRLNLKPDCYTKFTDFVATVMQEMQKKEGIYFNYLSLFNEPDGSWNWTDPKQEGSPATNAEVAKIVRQMSLELINRGFNTQILVNESSDYRCMFSNQKTDWQRGNQIQSFFSPDSAATYLGDVPNVGRLMTGHSYWTNTPLQDLRDYRCQLRDTLRKYEVGFWQSEVCIMRNDTEIGGGKGFDRSMKTALYVARIIHHDVVYANAKSWQWWRAVATGDYKDGLIRVYPDSTFVNGKVEDSKLLWALGNYSRFVRPGAIRLSVSAYDHFGNLIPNGDTEQEGLMCTAYRNINGSMVMVVINYGEENRTFTVDEDGLVMRKWQQYRTSEHEEENLKPVGIISGKITIPARSIVTLVSVMYNN